ncbi:MAG TPA: RNHCP domain-containing protein [Candidatus Paceibacterota bacterium]
MFIRTIEDFVCENCGVNVHGDGYTNHCPKCLWSKHVDVNPGDRAASCGGFMEPISLEIKSGEERLIHRCKRCGKEQSNRLSVGDNRDIINRL